MRLTRRSIVRPVFASVIALLIIVLGVGAIFRLPVREYPDIDDPTVTVTVVYPGAAAEVVEREVTEPIEEAVSAVEGVRQIRARSTDGRSQVEIEFVLERNLDLAAADVRDRVSTVRDELPDEAEEPEIAQQTLTAEVIMWLLLTSDELDLMQLSDFADRVVTDSLSTLPGVASVLVGGERRYAMRIWLDPAAMAARQVTVLDVEEALAEQNLELPAGRIVSDTRELTIRSMTELSDPEQYRRLVLRKEGATLVRLGDVARIEYGPEIFRTTVRYNGKPAVGLGVVRQTGSNTVAVAEAVQERIAQIRARLPEDVALVESFNETVFIAASIEQILLTLAITVVLVVLVVYLALGSWRSTIVPIATIPSSVIAAFAILYLFDFSINVLTLLALILAIGLLVDDAIVVAENIFRYSERGKPRLLAADLGAREVAFAVIATTAVLLAVIAPLTLLTGDAGRLFTEFATALGGALAVSSLMALTVGVMLASKLIDAGRLKSGRYYRAVSRAFDSAGEGYLRLLRRVLDGRWWVLSGALVLALATAWLYNALPRELSPREDRGVVFIPVEGPEGATMTYMRDILIEVEDILLPLTGPDGPGDYIVSLVAPRSGGQGPVNSGIVIFGLKPWSEREASQFEIVDRLLPELGAITGAQVFAINPPSLTGANFEQPVQMTLGASTAAEAARWAQEMLAEAQQVPGIVQARVDYQPTNPQLRLSIDRDRAGELGITMRDIGRTLQILMGGEDITDFSISAETYEVMVRADRPFRNRPDAIGDVYMRTEGGGLVPLSSLVAFETVGRPANLFRTDRLPSATISASLAPGAALGDVLAELEARAERILPPTVAISYRGVSEDYQSSAAAFLVAFILAMLIVYLVLAAQFESFVQPIVLLAGVPLAVSGALLTLLLAGETVNIFTQIGLILAIGIMAKNAILLVEFINQLRDRGQGFREAIENAARIRFRPILMTSIATLFGAMPLAVTFGPGAEVRRTLGFVIIGGVGAATLLALFLVPPLYMVIARRTKARAAVEKELDAQRRADGERHADRPGSAGAGKVPEPAPGE